MLVNVRNRPIRVSFGEYPGQFVVEARGQAEVSIWFSALYNAKTAPVDCPRQEDPDHHHRTIITFPALKKHPIPKALMILCSDDFVNQTNLTMLPLQVMAFSGVDHLAVCIDDHWVQLVPMQPDEIPSKTRFDLIE